MSILRNLDERFCSSVYEVRHLISAPNIIYYLIYKDEIIIVSILDCRRSPDFISEQIDTFLKQYSK